eukprot:CAMPEP_0184290060 /NCGR_PEP_ID=MMETSP1049-20130417/2400_1 /TAXON_ID=77928 /ORGANISM="Proteomonas sulcata, Strain CCMP704" /LENGTH=140 /DNA_ID=CAMNT_0026597087 /DNA_START=383 /DNA_END=805 /DNA_ORIENTATION=+
MSAGAEGWLKPRGLVSSEAGDLNWPIRATDGHLAQPAAQISPNPALSPPKLSFEQDAAQVDGMAQSAGQLLGFARGGEKHGEKLSPAPTTAPPLPVLTPPLRTGRGPDTSSRNNEREGLGRAIWGSGGAGAPAVLCLFVL